MKAPDSKDSPRPWRVLSSRSLHENPYYAVVSEEIEIEDGSCREYYTIRFPRPAVGVVVRRGSSFLLLRQYRHIIDEYVWAIPSGGTAQGETLVEAALRELEEETGYSTVSLEHLVSCYASYGCSNQRFEIFLANSVHQVSSQFDESEVLEIRWFSRQEVLDMVNRNGIVDNLSLSPILLSLLRDTTR